MGPTYRNLCGNDAFDTDLLFQMTRLGKIKGQLHAKPGFGRRAECLGQPVCHLDGYGRFFIDQMRERLAANTESPRADFEARIAAQRRELIGGS